MELKISFEEISDYVKNHYDKSVSISMVSVREVRVAYTQSLFITNVQVPLNIKIERVEPLSVSLSYSGKLGIDTLIKGLIAFLKVKLPILADALVTGNGNLVTIVLDKFMKSDVLGTKIALKDILFRNDGILIITELL